MSKPLIIGLTGQTGSGKSTICDTFISERFAVIDCDQVARKVTEDSSPCCHELSRHFPSCFDRKLHLNRKALGAIVFNDKEKLELLNSLIFPFINVEIEAEINSCIHSGFEYIVLDAPTLFEAGADRLCDIVISCTADMETRINRIIERDSISYEQASARAASQHSEAFFEEHSDIVIENNGSIGALKNAADYIIYTVKVRKYGCKKEKQKEEKE